KVFGGGEISAEHLAKGLAERGVDVSVLTSKFRGLKKYEEKDGVKIHRRLSTGTGPTSMIKRKLLFPRRTPLGGSIQIREEPSSFIPH
ncbi:MAG: glycosyltransferase, partial [Candidatus Altiarchaeota archaeon]|nr:glycosyltransferase [Candidatus Altiarchaeota archaeon]